MAASYIQFLLKPNLLLGGGSKLARRDQVKAAFCLRDLLLDFTFAPVRPYHIAIL
jgi:hypothetical protein